MQLRDWFINARAGGLAGWRAGGHGRSCPSSVRVIRTLYEYSALYRGIACCFGTDRYYSVQVDVHCRAVYPYSQPKRRRPVWPLPVLSS